MIAFEIIDVTPEVIVVKVDDTLMPITINEQSMKSSMYDIITNYNMDGDV